MNAEVADAEAVVLEVVPLEALEKFLAELDLHMDGFEEERHDDEGFEVADLEYDPEYNEVGRFERWFVEILSVLVDDASRALATFWRLLKMKRSLTRQGKKLEGRLSRRLRSVQAECSICFEGIKEVIEEPSARVLRGMGFLYNRIIEFVYEVASYREDPEPTSWHHELVEA